MAANNLQDLSWERKPSVAGMFYPAGKEKLKTVVLDYLAQAKDIPLVRTPYGIIVPHAGYVYSAPVAAYAYQAVRNVDFDTVILIGRSHRSYFQGASIDNSACNVTPFGKVMTDRDLFEYFSQHDAVHVDTEAVISEHSLEVQLPFLQIVAKREFTITSLLLGEETRETRTAIADAVYRARSTFPDKRFLVVCSTDLSHYHSYKEAVAIDTRFKEKLEAFDITGLEEGLSSRSIEACGGAAVLVTLIAAKEDGCKNVRVLNFRNSGDTSGTKDQVVGYLSAIIY